MQFKLFSYKILNNNHHLYNNILDISLILKNCSYVNIASDNVTKNAAILFILFSFSHVENNVDEMEEIVGILLLFDINRHIGDHIIQYIENKKT